MKSILITGSNGLLGQKLLGLLENQSEYKVYATARGGNRVSTFNNFEYYSLDICNKVQQVIGDLKSDYVINTPVMTNVDQCEEDRELCWDLNVNAVKYLVAACQKANTFLLHLSTDFIFDGQNGSYKEDAHPNPISCYEESKLAAVKMLKESNVEWAIARTVLVFGITEKMSRSNINLWVKNSLEEGKKLQIVDDQWRTPTLAEDLAQGCFLICKKHANGIFNILGKEMLTPYDVAIQTVQFFDLDQSLIEKTDGSKFQQRAKRPAKTGFVLDKAETQLSYHSHTFMGGIEILSKQL